MCLIVKFINQSIDTEDFCDISSVLDPGGGGGGGGGGGAGGYVPPPPQEAVSAIKTFFAWYMMLLQVYTEMHSWERLPR